MGPATFSFQPNCFIHRVSTLSWPWTMKLYRTENLHSPEHPVTAAVLRDATKLHLCKSYMRTAPCVGPGYLVEVFNSDFPGYRGKSASGPRIVVIHGLSVNIFGTVYHVWWVTPSAIRETPCLEVTGSSDMSWTIQIAATSKSTVVGYKLVYFVGEEPETL
jgi:hypothetical protein